MYLSFTTSFGSDYGVLFTNFRRALELIAWDGLPERGRTEEGPLGGWSDVVIEIRKIVIAFLVFPFRLSLYRA